jgi:hypothetical protein
MPELRRWHWRGSPDSRGIVVRSKDRRAGDYSRGAGRRGLPDCGDILSAIDLNDRMEIMLGAQRAQAPDFGQHFGKKGLSTETGIHRHHQNDIAKMQDIFDEFGRARRIENDTSLLC